MANDPGASSGPRRFLEGDPRYLREVQYADSSKLAARANLHVRYGRGTWFPWWAEQVPWPTPPGRAVTVLEVGCGAGWLWAEALEQLPAERIELTLTDLSPGMVDEAVARVEALGRFAAVVGRTADAQDLPMDDDGFDVVAANQMLYHLPDPVRGVAEIARVLAPDGVAAVATHGHIHLRELWEIRTEVFGAPVGHERSHAITDVFGLETGEPILRDRFGSVELARYDDRLRCTDSADVVAFLRSSPPGEDATPAELAQLRAAVGRRFDAGGGIFEVTKDSGVFLCTRPR